MSPITTIQEMDFSKSEQYTLSIRINTDGFSFSIFDPSAESPYLFFDLAIDPSLPIIANFKNLVAHNPFLSQLYKRVNIILVNTRTVVHPLDLFSPDIKERLYQFGQREVKTNSQIAYNILEQKKLAVLFSINKTLYNFLNEHFRNPHFFAQSTPLLAYYAQKSKERNCKKLFAHIENGNIHLFAYNKGKLLLTNTFQAKELSNQVYYILYVWKQINLSQQEDELLLAGQVSSSDQLVEILRKYIASVSILQDQRYIDLKAINLCEL